MSGIPGSILLTLLSPRFGTLAGRYGPRLSWSSAGDHGRRRALVRPGAGDETPWLRRASATRQLPPADRLPGQPAARLHPLRHRDLDPGRPADLGADDLGPVRNSGLGSAINNAISRIGPQLAGAAIFVAVTATFYSSLASRIGADPARRRCGRWSARSTDPAPGTARLAAAATLASGDAFHVAMLVGAGLMLAGAVVNLVGIGNIESPAR